MKEQLAYKLTSQQRITVVYLKRNFTTGLLSLLAAFQSTQAIAVDWKTECGRSHSESGQCRHIKDDATLMGQQGILKTIVFPDGESKQYFYTGGTVENLEGLKVRTAGGGGNGSLPTDIPKAAIDCISGSDPAMCSCGLVPILINCILHDRCIEAVTQQANHLWIID